MQRWSGRVAVVTGASAGIGAVIAERLVKEGMKVVGLARRVEKIQAIAVGLNDAPGKLYALKTDVSKEEDILEAFKWVKANLGGVDVMVNNAAALHSLNLTDGSTSKWKDLLDVNILGLSICTREAIQSMKERGVDDGHIIHINSGAGHRIITFPGVYMYSATKHAITVLTEGLRKELVQLKSNIRVTVLSKCITKVNDDQVVSQTSEQCVQSISPGLTKSEATSNPDLPGDVLDAMKHVPILEPEDVADAVVFVLSRPARVQVHELMLFPTGEHF